MCSLGYGGKGGLHGDSGGPYMINDKLTGQYVQTGKMFFTLATCIENSILVIFICKSNRSPKSTNQGLTEI